MKYKLGYCAAVVDMSDFRNFMWLKEAARQCEQLILGIPNEEVMSGLDSEKPYCSDEVRDYWLNIKWISEVEVLNEELLDYKEAYYKYKFDVCFYGSEYGSRFQEDSKFMKEHGVEFLSLQPTTMKNGKEKCALDFALDYCNIARKIILFGTGAYFDYYMRSYGNQYVPAYAVDNAADKWGTSKAGIQIKNPAELANESPKNVFIIICSKNYKSMVEQLQNEGDFDYCSLLYWNEIALLENYYYQALIKKDIQDTLRTIHEINYGLLSEFDRLCRQHNVEYFLNYGSLLGAIRHGGFIPWDNDVDTVMTRDNYEKLSQFQDELDSQYYWAPIDLLGEKKYYDCVPRVGYKAAYIRLDKDACRFYENQNNRIHLDMFLIDKTYDNFRGRLQRLELAFIYGLMNAYRHESFFFDYNKKMQFANMILRVIGRCIPLKLLRKRADKVARRFNNDKNAPYYFISNDALCKLKLLFPKEIFDHAVSLKFGDIDASVACGYDEMCRILFGEYMNLPSKKDRVPHFGRLLITSDLFVFHEPE